MEKLDFEYVVDYTLPAIYLKEKHFSMVQTALNYSENGGSLSDIYDTHGTEATFSKEDMKNVGLVILKNAPENTRWAAITVARAIMRGSKVVFTEKSDIFCAKCNGNCVK